MMRKFYDFGVACVYAVGAIGGFGYAAWCKAWFIAACIVGLAAMAFPYVRDAVKDLLA